MRILIVSTLKRRVGPDIFASRSRIIYQLSEGLAKRGHEVSLLGTADSQIPGVNIIPVLDKGWVDLPPAENDFQRDVASLIKQSKMIVDLQESFDVVHTHTNPEFLPITISKELKIPMVTTFHSLYTDYIDELLSFYPENNRIVALSNAYKKLYSKTTITDVVYNGVDSSLYKYKEQKQDYLLWVGRLARGKKDNGEYIDQKGVKWAIQLAEQTNSALLMAGPCEDINFFNKDVKPHLNDKIQWVGEISSEQSLPVEKVVDLMQNAKAFLMTVNQEEPFGLVMAEAMACGTPVIAFNRGAVSEIIRDGLTGFIVDPDAQISKPAEEMWIVKKTGLDGLCEAVERIYLMSESESRQMHENCRKRVEENFTIEKMVENYEKVYQEAITK